MTIVLTIINIISLYDRVVNKQELVEKTATKMNKNAPQTH